MHGVYLPIDSFVVARFRYKGFRYNEVRLYLGEKYKYARTCLAKMGPFRWATVSAVKIAYSAL